MHHLRKHPKSGTYYYRQAVPKMLQKIWGKKEIILSLRTKEGREARLIAYHISAKMLVEFEQAKKAVADKPDISEIVRQLQANPGSNPVSKWEVNLPGGFSISTNPQATDKELEQRQALEALKAITEAQSRTQPQIPQKSPVEDHTALISALAGSQLKNLHGGIAEYLAELEARQLKSIRHIKPTLTEFGKWISTQHQNIAANQVKANHIKDYKQYLRTKAPNKKAKSIGLSEASIYKKLGFIETFFRWCQDQNYYPDGERKLPTYKQKGQKPNAVNSGTSYQPFTYQDLEQIFSPQDYFKRNKTPHQHWIPLLGAYTGARLAEICYINPHNITDKNPEKIWTIEFFEKTKNASSQRTIPVHQDLIAAGFLDYLEMLTFYFPDSTNLFPYSNNPDKAAGGGFARYLDRIKITAKTKVFHSFRKNVASQLKMAGCPEDYRKYYIGHLDKSLHNTIYAGMDQPISLFHREIQKISYPIKLENFKKENKKFEKYLGRQVIVKKRS